MTESAREDEQQLEAALDALAEAAVAETRAIWLQGLIGGPREVLAERDGTGHAPNFARVQLLPGTPAGNLVTVTPTRIVEGLLA